MKKLETRVSENMKQKTKEKEAEIAKYFSVLTRFQESVYKNHK